MERDLPASKASREKPTTPVTPRAVLTGAVAVALLAVINPYLAFQAHTWDVGSGSLLGSPVVVLFLLVLINGLLIRLWPGRAFTRGELLVCYGMLIVSVGLAMQGGLPYIVSATVYPFYMATPENGWYSSVAIVSEKAVNANFTRTAPSGWVIGAIIGGVAAAITLRLVTRHRKGSQNRKETGN